MSRDLNPKLTPELDSEVFISDSMRQKRTTATLVRLSLIGIVALVIVAVLVLPVLAIFAAALSKGVGPYFTGIFSNETWQALTLTMVTVAIVVPLNTIFALALAWAVTKTKARGSTWLLVLTDLPLTISPVVTGLMLILLYGQRSWLGSHLHQLGFDIVYSVPAVILATLFVTVPYVAKQILPQLEAQNRQVEEAALTLGAGGLAIFRRITLPSIKLSLVQGVILTAARAAGEFGAVSMVSGHIRGLTTTLPQHVEILYNEYRFTAAYAVASILALFAILSLAVKAFFMNAAESSPSSNGTRGAI